MFLPGVIHTADEVFDKDEICSAYFFLILSYGTCAFSTEKRKYTPVIREPYAIFSRTAASA
jgi:hypothetical protein